MNELVFLQNDQTLTTSLKIAEYFEKNHQHVMRDIRGISEEMDVSNFGQMFRKTTYADTSLKDFCPTKDSGEHHPRRFFETYSRAGLFDRTRIEVK